jgi:DNA polymerase III gamma/tau subunit
METQFSGKIKKYLDRLANSGKRPNSFLFFGPGGTGKEEAAFYFIGKVLNRENDEEFFRLARKGSHPDVVLLEPETVEDKAGRIREKEITISQIREARDKMKFFPYELKQKFCLIKKAERMNRQAQNSLLKILEEPTESTVFILLASGAESVLPTIFSRCAPLRFADAGLPKWKEENRDRLRNIFTEEIHEKLGYAQELAKNREGAAEVLEDWEKIMSEGMKNILSGGDRKEWRKAAITEELLQKNREAINKIRNSNASARAVVESLLIDMNWK